MNRREFLAGVAACAIARPNLTPTPIAELIQTPAAALPAGVSYAEFVTAILRNICAANGMTYEELTGRWPPQREAKMPRTWTIEQVIEQAHHIAQVWCPGVEWRDLDQNTREDFWDSARIDCGAPADLQPPESFWE